ncbi:hypothetical protein EHQ58_18375 [Leptospira ognonensis]|uniref:Uncharacterized protein n=1 Tax=Leptospira ognonensis TaxID=2484945 RepID=A0A4R9JT30_9LEPT|nr:hypothetical protein [Leptospira ognonensis]TGL55888.1 hypothetical protein EHQ58_18375 [Leptospira ognonensis]
MSAFQKVLILFSLVLFFSDCQKREDTTIQKNVLTYLIGCNGGSLTACQASCAATYPTLTGDNYPTATTCFSNCSTYCSVTNIYLLISNK